MKEIKLTHQHNDRVFNYEFTELNAKGEKIAFTLTRCEDNELKNSLPKMWKKKGYIDRVLNDYWTLDTYVYCKEGCFGAYNPQHKRSEDGKIGVINFEYMFEATEENKIKLINELEKRAFLL